MSLNDKTCNIIMQWMKYHAIVDVAEDKSYKFDLGNAYLYPHQLAWQEEIFL